MVKRRPGGNRFPKGKPKIKVQSRLNKLLIDYSEEEIILAFGVIQLKNMFITFLDINGGKK